mmetsp:Transcript_14068/g.27213  ORF Transcript_14068/g.27213 Transcript_14068/m.27213 type:complete len:337 (+) Transcript_14068:2-1012(+)
MVALRHGLKQPLLHRPIVVARYATASATAPPLVRLPGAAALAGCGLAAATSLAWGLHDRGNTFADETGDAIHLPIDLILVRHGQSEANMMIEMKKKGDMSGQHAMDAARKHDSMMRLTDLGREQARCVGAWLTKHLGIFDKFYVSEYVRTKETAAMMALPQARWQADMMIRERDQGVQDGQGDVKMNLSEEELQRYKKSPMYWQPVAGESMSILCQRVRLFLHRIQQNATGMRVVVVCHYRTIHAFRLLLEDTRQENYEKLLADHMPNCCIWWYSRRDEDGRVRSHICTCKRIEVLPDGSSNIITFPVKSSHSTDEELLAEVNKVKQVLNNGGVVQ